MKDRIMNSKPVTWLTGTRISRFFAGNRFFSKFWNYEMISYLIAGVLTTAVNYIVYFIVPHFNGVFQGFDVIVKTVVSWIFAVLFAFFVNKVFVFDSPKWSASVLYKEFIPFITARLLSLGFDELFMWVTVGLLHLNEPLFKILSNVFVLLANYFASKFIIFKKPRNDGDDKQ